MKHLFQKQNKWEFLMLSFLILVILFFISINAGYTPIGFRDILRILAGGGEARENLVIFDFRLPRIVIAILVGMGFSLSGCVLQGITRNPLADPGLMGINSGAGIVVVIFMTLSGTLSIGGVLTLPFFSLLGALLTSVILYSISIQKNAGLNSTRLILNGVAIQAGINAMMTIIVLQLDDTQYNFLAVWQAGSIWNSNWKLVVSLLPWIVLGMLYLFLKAKELDLLMVGDELSSGLGVAVNKEKKSLLFAAVALAAASVTVSGSLHFVGLLGPHLARRLVGSRHKILLPFCAITGAILVLLADTIGRTIVSPSEIPAGIVAAILGAPYFIFLLITNNKSKVKER
ncbi:iron complex transport system permease protein [Lachnotalea glycerini]|uniref:Iron complex transport system permease protein n=1 Tax=Lachnotalea glycerini TaxID=1763509 RepID=A0A318F1I9_9FIRM|nr:iron ABC transporter permease [Lachnotalea glycerini]PXV95728.1 iron complex transport system permease protein [Lachnotalea glycerini]